MKSNLKDNETLKSQRHNATCVPKCRLLLHENSIFVKRVQIFNKMPKIIKEIQNKSVIKFKLKMFLIKKGLI